MSSLQTSFILQDSNKATKGVQWSREVKQLFRANGCEEIALGSIRYPPNPDTAEAINTNRVMMDEYEEQMVLYQQAVVDAATNNLQPPVIPVQPQMLPVPDERDEPTIPPKPIPRGNANAQAAALQTWRQDREFIFRLIQDLISRREKFMSKSSIGMQIILSSISPELRRRVDQQTVSLHTLWTAIIVIINQRTVSDIDQLEREYKSLKQQTNQSLNDYLAIRQDVEEALAGSGRPVDDIQKKVKYVQSLLPQYDIIRAQVQSDHTKSLEECHILLLTEENHNLNRNKETSTLLEQKDNQIRKLQQQLAQAKNLPSKVGNIMNTSVKTSKSEQKSTSSLLICEKCGRKGHSQKDCLKDVVCDTCGKKGHATSSCFKTTPCPICKVVGHGKRQCTAKNKSETLISSSKPDDPDDNFPYFTGMLMCSSIDVTESNISEQTVNIDQKYDKLNKVISINKDAYRDFIVSDSGCNVAVTRYPEFIELEKSNASHYTVQMANNSSSKSIKVGSTGNYIPVLLLVEDVQVDLLSVSQLDKLNMKIIYENQTATIIDPQYNNIISTGILYNGLYFHRKKDFYHNWIEQDDNVNPPELRYPIINNTIMDDTVASADVKLLDTKPASSILLYHQRSNHKSYYKMLQELKHDMVIGTGFTYDQLLAHGPFHCDICSRTKLQRLPRYTSTSLRPIAPVGTHWCIDIKGPFIRTRNGYIYDFCGIDEGSQATVHYPMKSKDDVVKCLRRLLSMVKANQMEVKGISVIQSDFEKVFTTGLFPAECQNLNIRMQYSSPYIKEQNGMIEAAIKQDYNNARANMLKANVKHFLWDFALLYVSQTRFVSAPSLHYGQYKTPFEHWKGYKPDVSYLRTFGSVAYFLVDKAQRISVFNPVAAVGILLNYTVNTKGCYDILHLQKPYLIYPRSDVVFLEDLNISSSITDPNIHEIQSPNSISLVSPDPTSPSFTIITNDQIPKKINLITSNVSQLEQLINQPQFSIQKVFQHPNRDLFMQSLQDEWEGLCKLGTFGPFMDRQGFQLPPDSILVPLMITFRVTSTANANELKVKARIVLRGDKVPINARGECYSPTAQPSSIKLLYNLSIQYGYHIFKSDVTQAYLHAQAPSNMYAIIPKQLSGFHEDKIAKLQLALYGHPQSGRLFNQYADQSLQLKGYNPTVSDPCMYLKEYVLEGVHHKIIIILYVDDIGIFGTNSDCKVQFFNDMATLFRLKDEGDLRRYLSMDIESNYSQGWLTMNQSQFAIQCIKKFNITKGFRTPITAIQLQTITDNVALTDIPTTVMEKIGSIRYLCDNTRYDLLYAANRASQDPTGNISDRALGYVKNTISKELTFTRDPQGINLHAYVDASWKQPPNAASYYGYAIFLNNKSAAIYATSKKIKNTVPQSIFESEFLGICECAKTLLHFRYLLEEIHLPQSAPSIIYTDSESAIFHILNPNYSPNNRHIHPKFYAIRKWVQNKVIKLVHIGSDGNVADMFTKPLDFPILNQHAVKAMGQKTN